MSILIDFKSEEEGIGGERENIYKKKGKYLFLKISWTW